MNVDGIFVSKAEEIADASIVSGEINGSGYLVLTNGAGTEFNAGLVVPPLPELVRVEFFDDYDPVAGYLPWDPDPDAKWHHVQLIGGGGGGGSGGDGGSDTASGCGGGGGGWIDCWLPQAALAPYSDIRLEIGFGGVGGVGNGITGDDGQYTWLYVFDGGTVRPIALAEAGTGGTTGDSAGGSGDTGTPGVAGNIFGGNGKAGKNDFSTPDGAPSAMKGGGGGGGGINQGSGAFNMSGGTGGSSNGGGVPTVDSSGTHAFYLALKQGGGGGMGGGTDGSGNPTAGANGGLYGGGGGGGAGANGNVSNGGDGAPGCAVIATYF